MSISGQTFGPYRLLEPLGQGGMGMVWRARHEVSGQAVALKTVLVPRAGLLQSIRREIHALARIRHPGIVPIFEEGMEQGVPWYSMELVQGLSLRAHASLLRHETRFGAGPGLPRQARAGPRSQDGPELLRTWTEPLDTDRSISAPQNTAPLPARGQGVPSTAPGAQDAAGVVSNPVAASRGTHRSVLGLIRQLCGALAFLHGEGIVHCDLKPDNVLLRPDGRTVLVDFGLAQQAVADELSREALEVSPVAVGTVVYMAPEQARGELLDGRADLYSLGCMLYELLTGRPPFVSDTVSEVLRMHREAVPEPPSRLAEGVSRGLDELVLRLLAKQPRDRLGYAADVAAELAKLGAWDDALSGPRPMPYLYRPALAGRAGPLAELRRHARRARSGHGGLVLVAGESGIGKTRLLVELSRMAGAAGLYVLAGECLPSVGARVSIDASDVSLQSSDARSGGGGPLEALRKPLQALADRCRERGPEATGRLLGRRGKVLELYEPALESLPGLEAYPPAPELPPDAARLRLWSYLTETFAALCQEQTTVLLLDDLQWADELTLGFLGAWLRTLPGKARPQARMLVVATYRSEEAGTLLADFSQHWNGLPTVTRIELGRLQEEAVGVMISDMLALERPPEALTRFLALESEGNPFFLSEYLRTALCEGLLWRDEQGNWRVLDGAIRDREAGFRKAQGQQGAPGTFESLALPRSLRQVVLRRLQGLPDAALRFVEAASVLGRELDASLLQAMLGLEEADLFGALALLLKRQVLEEPSAGRLRFAHDKLREVASAGLTPARRSLLHRSAAETIDALGAAARSRHLGTLGYHWDEAGEPGKAMECYLLAARAAASRFEHAQAESLYRAHLRLIELPNPQSVGVRNELAEKVLRPRGRSHEMLAEHLAALEEARRIGDRPGEIESLVSVGRAWHLFGRNDEARPFLEQALSLARAENDRKSEGNALYALAVGLAAQGRLDEARPFYELALSLHRERGDRQSEGVVLSSLANLIAVQGGLEQAQRLYQQAVDINRELGDRRREFDVLGNLAILHQGHGRIEQARSLFEQVLANAREVGHLHSEGITLSNLTVNFAIEGRLEEARRLAEESLRIFREIGARRREGNILSNLGRLYRDLGRLDEAVEWLDQALAVDREIGVRSGEGGTLANLASVYFEQGRFSEGRELFERALAILREVRDPRSEGGALVGLASLELLVCGGSSRAGQFLDRAEELLEPLGDKLGLAKAACCRAHLILAGEGSTASKLCSGRAFLERAAALAAAIDTGADVELKKAMESLRLALAAFEAGQWSRLLHGYLVETLPERVRERLIPGGLPGPIPAAHEGQERAAAGSQDQVSGL